MEATKVMDDFDRELAEASGQRTKVWRDVRAGKFTASAMWRLMGDPRSKEAKERGDWSDEATTYINEKVAEEITGFVHEGPTAAALEWGTELEPVAKKHFSALTGRQVFEAGFKIYNAHAGGSIDGDADGPIIEIKCPYNSGNHIEYMKLKKGIELQTEFPKIWWQIQSNLLFNDKPMCYFVSFDPRFPDKQKMKIVEVHALKADQDRIVERINRAIKTKMNLVEQLTA
jgi:YqaJ-like recombinase protein